MADRPHASRRCAASRGVSLKDANHGEDVVGGRTPSPTDLAASAFRARVAERRLATASIHDRGRNAGFRIASAARSFDARPSMPIEVVIFDIDGTLIDSVDQHAMAWVETLKHFGGDAAFDEVRAQIGKGGDQLMPVFLSAEFIAARGEEVERFGGDLFKRTFLPSLSPFPGVPALFERLRRGGKRTALASSAKAEELQRYQAIAGIEGLVDAAASSDDARRSKPAPDIFLAALRKAKVSPEAAIVVGDSPYDAQAAGAAGMRAVGLLCGGFPQADLRAAGYASLYHDPEDLLRNLDASLLA